ncbi:MAG: Ig-like domain-containing protein [Bacteroidales bacterium]|nr:Ig-like domain-containing protein [Bacteroidales bacterium]
MKKGLFAAFAAIILLTVSCQPAAEGEAGIRALSVDPAELTLVEGQMESLSVAVVPEAAHYLFATWSSSDESIAKINKKGTVKALSEGSVTITASIGEVTGTCRLTVTRNLTPVSGVSLITRELTLGRGNSEQLTVRVEPEMAADKRVTWSSTDPSVASVSDGWVSGVGAGTCEIVVRTVDGGFEDRCRVLVQDIAVEEIAFSNGSPNAIIAEAGGSFTLSVSYTPVTTSEREVSWQSSDEALATVTPAGDGQGEIRFAEGRTGPVTIRATAGQAHASASQAFFIKGPADPVLLPEGSVYAGRRATYRFNTAAYPEARDLSWSADGRTLSGEEVTFAWDKGGDNELILNALFGLTPIRLGVPVPTEEWLCDIPLDGANPRNTYPVFNHAQTRAYFVTRGARRLYELNLETGRLGWMFDMNQGKNDNGGDICVNPHSGDIYCSNQTTVFCLTPDGTKRWELPVPTGGSASALAGCGPGLSNDCSVVFLPLTDKRFVAVDAASGAILDGFDVETTHIQFAVYGADDIVLLSTVTGGKGGLKFVSFRDGKFGPVTAEDSPSPDPTDITAPAVSRDQRTAWFPCNDGLLVTVDLAARKVTGATQLADGYLQGLCLTPGDWMFFASQTKAPVNRISLSGPLQPSSVLTPYTNGNSNYLNFTTVACDTDGNVYFFIKEDGAGNSVFYRLGAADGRYRPEEIASTPKQNNDPQGFFNFGGGCLIGGGGTNAKNHVLVRCIDAVRAPLWSGPGGDACATKNANLVYAE